MKNRNINVERCKPSIDVGRCNICSNVFATRVLYFENIQEIRFCDECWKKFKEMIKMEDFKDSIEENTRKACDEALGNSKKGD